jgi:hypothetical protein
MKMHVGSCVVTEKSAKALLVPLESTLRFRVTEAVNAVIGEMCTGANAMITI